MLQSSLIPPLFQPVVVVVGTVVVTLLTAVVVTATAHVAHRRPHDHCWICRRSEAGGR